MWISFYAFNLSKFPIIGCKGSKNNGTERDLLQYQSWLCGATIARINASKVSMRDLLMIKAISHLMVGGIDGKMEL